MLVGVGDVGEALMEGIKSDGDGRFENAIDVEEEFRSCCCEDEEWQDTEECLAEFSSSEDEGGEDIDDDDESSDDESSDDEDVDEFSLRMYFKGVSVSNTGGLVSRASGIGVVMETSDGDSVFQVQKKLDFFVEDSVADHLALLDGLIEAQRNGVQRIVAFTDSEDVYHQIGEAEPHEDQLLVALGYRILELANKFEDFVLKLVCRSELERPLKLAREAVGILDLFIKECRICWCEESEQSHIMKLKCNHSFCLDCMIMYVEGKLQALQIPIKCPQVRCKHYMSTNEFKSFLPASVHRSLERAIVEANVLYCPFPNCSVLFSSNQCSSSRASSSSQSDTSCVECQECHRLICTACRVPWHSSMSCDEYQSLPAEERDAGDVPLIRLAQNNNWRLCQQCGRMVELIQGSYHATGWCGHEFCYDCGAAYHDGRQTCQCVFWDDRDVDYNSEHSTPSIQEADQWRWEPFNLLPSIADGYSEQELAQLALIQRFLAGGFGLNDDYQHPNHSQSSPRRSESYLDAIKDLNQLPWLERFVSVISDSCNEYYIQ